MPLELNKIYNMDCLEGLRHLENDVIDAVVSDPPYQLTDIKKTGVNLDNELNENQVKRGFMNKGWDVLPGIDVLTEVLRVMKPGAFALWLMTSRQDSQMEFLLKLKKAGFVISFSSIYWTYLSGFPKGINISRAIDKKLGVERIPTGIDQKFGRADSGIYYFNVNGENKKKFIRYDLPSSEMAKKMDGSYGGFQPKPAIEVIIVSMKPLSEKSYIEQALKNGKGITWLDDCRIPYASEEEYERTKRGIRVKTDRDIFNGGWKTVDSDLYHDRRGRYPTNLLVSDNILDIDSDNISHHFSLDAWWGNKIKDLPVEVQNSFPFIYVSKASKRERDNGLNGIINYHPTVKPIKLMSYLITLTTREGDIVLDPFIGSGTTAIASILLNRKFIGFERDPEYFKIAEMRIKHYENQKRVIEYE